MEIVSEEENQKTPSWCPCRIKLLLAVAVIGSSSLVATLLLKNRATVQTVSWQTERSVQGEIAISYFHRQSRHRFSKFRCTGSENDIGEWADRLCVFYHVCYDKETTHFHYYRLPDSDIKPLFYDSSRGMLTQFNQKNDGTEFVSLSAGGGKSWAPVIVNETYPEKDVTKLHQLHSLMKTRFADSNIAHGLWEDLGSISYSMDRMNLANQKLVIMHLDQIPNTTLIRMYNQYVLPAIADRPLIDVATYMSSFRTKYVCFDSLVTGGQLSVFPKERIKENHGREALFYNWRSKILLYNGFDPNFIPSQHRITITNKSHSIWARSGSKMHRAIVNLEEVEKFVKRTYPDIQTEVVEWHTIPFNVQLKKLLETTILITPCGGVSLIIPFLPNSAHAIVTDYYVSRPGFGFSAGQSASMEGAMLNHISHVRKEYYQIYGRQDFQFDYPGASDSREAASIIVNMTRLKLLIDKSLEEMEP